jgi:hypothetical protein
MPDSRSYAPDRTIAIVIGHAVTCSRGTPVSSRGSDAHAEASRQGRGYARSIDEGIAAGMRWGGPFHAVCHHPRTMRSPLAAVACIATLGVLGVIPVMLAGCPPTEKADKSDKKEPTPARGDSCSRVGQRCEVSPGKLGTCVQRDGCMDPKPSCFVCQSQH